jgi:hypothetical protein
VNREPAIADAIARAVAASGPRRVPLKPDLLVAAASVDRTAAASIGWRARVLAALEDLAAEGVLTLSKSTVDSELPRFVTRRAEPRPARDPEPPVVWHATLDWVARLEETGSLGVADRRVLASVNAWLPRRRGVRVPLRERSLEIFGDEKVLEALALGPLFGPGRLSLTQLDCFPCWPPVEQTDLGPGDWLVIENYTTYVSLSRRARELDFPGRIIWGSGTQVGTRLTALSASGTRPPPSCWYFGDLDAGGFQAARLAVRRAAELGLGHGHPRQSRVSTEIAQWAQTWLGGPLGTEIADLVRTGRRIVQEHVGLELLADTTLPAWFGRSPGAGK